MSENWGGPPGNEMSMVFVCRTLHQEKLQLPFESALITYRYAELLRGPDYLLLYVRLYSHDLQILNPSGGLEVNEALIT